MARQKITFTLTFKNYLQLVRLSFLNPKLYGQSIPEVKSFKDPLIFWLMTNTISSVMSSILKVILNQNPSLIFLAINQIVLSVPIFLAISFIMTLFLHIFARILGGRGSYKQSFAALSYSSAPAVFSWIPYLSILISLLPIYILIVSFKKVHHYSYLRASINIITPYLFLIILLFLLGLLGLLLNLDLLKTLHF